MNPSYYDRNQLNKKAPLSNMGSLFIFEENKNEPAKMNITNCEGCGFSKIEWLKRAKLKFAMTH